MRKSEDKKSNSDERLDKKNNLKDTLNMGSTKIFIIIFGLMIVYTVVMMILKKDVIHFSIT